MEIIHDFSKTLLSFVHALHIGKADAVRGFDIYFCVGLAHIEGHGVGAAHFVHHFLGTHLSNKNKDSHWQDPGQQHTQQRRGFFHDLTAKVCDSSLIKSLGPVGIFHNAGFINSSFFFIRKNDLIILNIDSADVSFFRHGHEGAVADFLNLHTGKLRHCEKIEQCHNGHNDHIVVNKRFFRSFYFVHNVPLSNSLAFFTCIQDTFLC